jgi:hypothetical protein
MTNDEINKLSKQASYKSLRPEEKKRLLKNLDFYKKGTDEKNKKLRELQLLQSARR